jgi:flagellar protein FliL
MARKEENEEEKSTRGGKKKTVILIVAAIATSVALAAGVAAYIVNGHRGEAAAESASGKSAEQAARKSPPAIYAIEPFIVNISDGRDMRYLKIRVEFETTAGPEAKAELDPYLAPLRDSILVLLTSKTLQEIQDLPGKNRLREEIFATASKILPPGKISRVYFTDFVVQ